MHTHLTYHTTSDLQAYSIIQLIDANGTVIDETNYCPCSMNFVFVEYAKTNTLNELIPAFCREGRYRDPNTWQYDNTAGLNLLHRGYTGHEMLPEFGLIHMNGRMYDPLLGRMLSPDNYVQDPNNPNNYNRYAYCMNNPLKYTDPSGELTWFDIGAGAMLIGGIIMTATGFGAPIGAGMILGGFSHFAYTINGVEDEGKSWNEASSYAGLSAGVNFSFGGDGNTEIPEFDDYSNTYQKNDNSAIIDIPLSLALDILVAGSKDQEVETAVYYFGGQGYYFEKTNEYRAFSKPRTQEEIENERYGISFVDEVDGKYIYNYQNTTGGGYAYSIDEKGYVRVNIDFLTTSRIKPSVMYHSHPDNSFASYTDKLFKINYGFDNFAVGWDGVIRSYTMILPFDVVINP